MLTKDDADRIADATTVLRPTWNRNQLLAVMGRETIRLRKQPKDVAAALAWIALDADTREPTRILESGPWWGTGNPVKVEPVNTSSLIRRPLADDCDVCLRPRTDHGPGRNDDHEYRQRNASGHGTPMPDDARARLTQLTTHPEQTEESA